MTSDISEYKLTEPNFVLLNILNSKRTREIAERAMLLIDIVNGM